MFSILKMTYRDKNYDSREFELKEDEVAEIEKMSLDECIENIEALIVDAKEYIPLFIYDYCCWVAMHNKKELYRAVNLQENPARKILFKGSQEITEKVALIKRFGNKKYTKQDIDDFLANKESVANRFSIVYINYLRRENKRRFIDYVSIYVFMQAVNQLFSIYKTNKLVYSFVDGCLKGEKDNKYLNILHRFWFFL